MNTNTKQSTEQYMGPLREDTEPKILWQEFEAISNIPRCTGAEGAVLRYIKSVAEAGKYESRQDRKGNLVVCLPATAGCESLPGLIVQGHVDMVCEKNMATEHDFAREGLRLRVDGDVLSANGTTLGADNGIAVAMMLAIMKSDAAHGDLELLFTVDEESGLVGALNLDPNIVKHRIMINLDSEEEGIFYIGCAGGMETEGTVPLEWMPAPSGLVNCRIVISGLGGGHSGAEIHREPGNSLVLARRLLACLPSEALVYNISGGDRHNVVPREALIELLLPESHLPALEDCIRGLEVAFHSEFAESEPLLRIAHQTSEKTNEKAPSADTSEKSPDADTKANKVASEKALEYPRQVITQASTERLLRLAMSLPHGILSMSRTMAGLVSTSTNLAAMFIREGSLRILTSQRSDIDSLLKDASEQVAMPIRLAGGTVQFLREYAGWQPNPKSELLKVARKLWREQQGSDAEVRSIHAGLECGVIGGKLGKVDMISFGPNIRGAHTPEEQTSIESCRKIFEFLLHLLPAIDI